MRCGLRRKPGGPERQSSSYKHQLYTVLDPPPAREGGLARIPARPLGWGRGQLGGEPRKGLLRLSLGKGAGDKKGLFPLPSMEIAPLPNAPTGSGGQGGRWGIWPARKGGRCLEAVRRLRRGLKGLSPGNPL